MPFSALPLAKTEVPTRLNAWGAYGSDDELGFLNRQTDETVAAAAASEIKTGVRVSLNAALDFQGEDFPPLLITDATLMNDQLTYVQVTDPSLDDRNS